MRTALGWATFIAGMILAWGVLLWVTTTTVHAHDWYTGKTDTNGISCCGDYDCGPIAFESVREVEGGFIVTLTKEQMLDVRSDLNMLYQGPYGSGVNVLFRDLVGGISEFIPYREAQPADDGKYSVCLRTGPASSNERGTGPQRWINCFFFPSNS